MDAKGISNANARRPSVEPPSRQSILPTSSPRFMFAPAGSDTHHGSKASGVRPGKAYRQDLNLRLVRIRGSLGGTP